MSPKTAYGSLRSVRSFSTGPLRSRVTLSVVSVPSTMAMMLKFSGRSCSSRQAPSVRVTTLVSASASTRMNSFTQSGSKLVLVITRLSQPNWLVKVCCVIPT